MYQFFSVYIRQKKISAKFEDDRIKTQGGHELFPPNGKSGPLCIGENGKIKQVKTPYQLESFSKWFYKHLASQKQKSPRSPPQSPSSRDVPPPMMPSTDGPSPIGDAAADSQTDVTPSPEEMVTD